MLKEGVTAWQVVSHSGVKVASLALRIIHEQSPGLRFVRSGQYRIEIAVRDGHKTNDPRTTHNRFEIVRRNASISVQPTCAFEKQLRVFQLGRSQIVRLTAVCELGIASGRATRHEICREEAVFQRA